MVRVEKLTLREMMLNFLEYRGLPEGLIKFSVPDYIKIGGKKCYVPATYEEFTKNICYGQRMFLSQKEENDFGSILRVMDGYFYTIVTGKKWDGDKALLFGKKILTCKVFQLYPVAMHLISFVNEMTEKEVTLLHRDPSKMELAAGIENLNVFAELTSLDFLRDAMKITIAEVLQTPYKECLVRFMLAKATNDFQEKYMQLAKEVSQPKSKYLGSSQELIK
jgi:hypothetical protein